jgi:hypothetical protein
MKVLKLIFIYLFFDILPNALTCSLIINEINLDDPNKSEKFEFIELKKIKCADQKPSLKLYSIIIIKELEDQFKKPIIVFSADLSLSTFRDTSEYFVIGSPSLNPDLPFSSESVRYRKKFRTPLQIDLQLKNDYLTKQLEDVIENGNKVPLAIILLKEKDGQQVGVKQLMMPFPEASRRSKIFAQHLVVNDELAGIIKNSLIDMYIFSRRSFINSFLNIFLILNHHLKFTTLVQNSMCKVIEMSV